MTGWFHIRGVPTVYYRDAKPESDDWPPKFWKFSLTTKKEASKPVAEAAFVDSRRFARIRLIDCPAMDIRNVTPLKENGPDPVVDRDIVTEEWLVEKCKAKRVPIKAMLLDQANISGIGNWVGYVITSLSTSDLNPRLPFQLSTTAPNELQRRAPLPLRHTPRTVRTYSHLFTSEASTFLSYPRHLSRRRDPRRKLQVPRDLALQAPMGQREKGLHQQTTERR